MDLEFGKWLFFSYGRISSRQLPSRPWLASLFGHGGRIWNLENDSSFSRGELARDNFQAGHDWGWDSLFDHGRILKNGYSFPRGRLALDNFQADCETHFLAMEGWSKVGCLGLALVNFLFWVWSNQTRTGADWQGDRRVLGIWWWYDDGC